MKKLEDIPKKEVFNVPDGYFDNLPNIIQSRVVGQSERKMWRPALYVLRYGLPVLVLGAIGLFWLNSNNTPSNVEDILASVETADLVAYLNETDLTTEELLESVQLDASEVDEIEGEVYGGELNDEDFEDLLDEI